MAFEEETPPSIPHTPSFTYIKMSSGSICVLPGIFGAAQKLKSDADSVQITKLLVAGGNPVMKAEVNSPPALAMIPSEGTLQGQVCGCTLLSANSILTCLCEEILVHSQKGFR